MTYMLYTGQTGLADGTAFTGANSGVGSAGFFFQAGTTSGGATIKHTTAAIGIARSISCAAPSGTGVARGDIVGLFSTKNLVMDIAFNAAARPVNANCRFIDVYGSGVYALRINLTVSGEIYVTDATNATVWTGTVKVPMTGAWRVGVRCVPATATTGRLELEWYDSPSATVPVETMPTITTGNFGVNALDTVYLGKITTTPIWTVAFAAVQIDDKRTTLFRAPASATATAIAGKNQSGLQPWVVASVAGSSIGSVLTWTQASGPAVTITPTGAKTSDVMLVPPNFDPSVVVMRATSDGATDEVTLTYLPANDGIVVSTNPVVVKPTLIGPR